jgi:hypothetical protein
MAIQISKGTITRGRFSGDCDDQQVTGLIATTLELSGSVGSTSCSIASPEYTGRYFGNNWTSNPGWLVGGDAPSLNYGYGSASDLDGPHELVFNHSDSQDTDDVRATAVGYINGLIGWLTARSTGSIELDTYYNLAQDNKIELVYGNFSTKTIYGTNTFIDPASNVRVGYFTESYDSSVNSISALNIAYVVRFSGSFDDPAIKASQGGTALGFSNQWWQLSGSLD